MEFIHWFLVLVLLFVTYLVRRIERLKHRAWYLDFSIRDVFL